MGGIRRLFSLPSLSLVAETSANIQAKGETMQATYNGSAEYRVAQALQEEAVRHAPKVSWPVVAELFFAAVLAGLLIWKILQ